MSLQLMSADHAAASFVIRNKNQPAQKEQTESRHVGHNGLRNKLIRQVLFRNPPGFHKSPYETEFPFGIISLAASLLGLICLGLFLVGSGASSALIIVAVIAAVLGIVFGAIGLNRPMKGYAIAGMILGILDIVAVIVGIVFAALVVLSLSAC